jgi:hypothetical protein
MQSQNLTTEELPLQVAIEQPPSVEDAVGRARFTLSR